MLKIYYSENLEFKLPVVAHLNLAEYLGFDPDLHIQATLHSRDKRTSAAKACLVGRPGKRLGGAFSKDVEVDYVLGQLVVSPPGTFEKSRFPNLISYGDKHGIPCSGVDEAEWEQCTAVIELFCKSEVGSVCIQGREG